VWKTVGVKVKGIAKTEIARFQSIYSAKSSPFLITPELFSGQWRKQQEVEEATFPTT